MTKEEKLRLKNLALLCLERVQEGKVDFGLGNSLVFHETDHKIADVYGGPYSETPIENMQSLSMAKNSVRVLSFGILQLLKENK